MVASSLSPEPPQDVFLWLYSLPLAPEYRPTLAEFQDPIAYIYKIEKEASQYGICKIVPPVPPCSRRTVIANFNRSLLARGAVAGSSDSKQVSTFTTRQQQIGLCPRKPRPVQKPVWQSGELYTFQEFEAKAKNFERSYLKKCCKRGSLSALEVETLYWKATADKPFSVEYANDMPGSAFPVVRTKSRGGGREAGEGLTVGDTAWNMRGVSRAKGSLLRFMKEEIPGVTSPMIYMAMLLSWFAWHVEDHDLHSLNYLHMGAGKTWYGVPRDAAVAFEEVVRVQGYGGEVNPLVTFATLGEKTTVMSPEVFISAGIPCCRLVQNAGEFVVTFPRAYHTGFSHGFNCGEAANIATPGWLKVANDAAVRRASINYPPMVSHVQLLYDLALELCSRERTSINMKPRSSRLKNKKKNEGETLVKELFVQNFKQNSDLLHMLSEGYSVVLLPENSADISVCSDLRVGSQLSMKPRMTLASYKYDRLPKASKELGDDADVLAAKQDIEAIKGFYSVRATRNFSLSKSDYMYNLPSMTLGTNSKMQNSIQSEALPDQRLFSCVMCGILTFACVAVIQPREAAARYLMSADCSFFNDWTVGFGGTHTGLMVAQREPITSEENPCSRTVDERIPVALRDTPDQSIYTQFRTGSQNNEFVSDAEAKTDTSALDLLASAYGNQSESEEDHAEPETDIVHGQSNSRNFTAETKGCDNDSGISPGDKNRVHDLSVSTFEPGDGHISDFYELPESKEDNGEFRSLRALGCLAEFEAENLASTKSIQLQNRPADPAPSFEIAHNTENARIIHSKETVENADAPLAPRFNEDCSRMHAFCLEHAVEVKQQLQPIGGVDVFLFCHPECSKIESEAKLVAKELGLDYIWNDISFRVASKKDEERILSALDSEEAIPSNGDWTVKLGINLFHSVNLSRSTFYSKQMPYNSVIYSAFGRSSLASSPKKSNVYERSSKQKEIVAGKWCGKVWMSNQVHPFLSQNNLEEQEQERNFTNWAMPDENVQKRQKLAETQTKRPSRKISRKMKIRPDYGSTKKTKCIDADNSLVDISHRKLPRTRRSKQPRVKENQDAISDDFLEDNFRLQHYRLLGRNEDKGIERDSAHLGIVTRNNVPQEQRRKLRGKQGTMIERHDSVSADSLRFTSYKESGRIPVSWQPKSFEKENSPSNDSEKHGTVSRGKQTENVERDDAISYNLPAGGSLKQYRRMRRGKRTKFAERGPKMSISGNDSHHRIGRISRGQQMIYAETNEAFSDDSVEHNCQSNRGISISKTTKFANSDNSSSCSSLENNSTQVHGKGPCSRPVKFVASEDVRGSYGSSDDDSDLRLRKIPPSRQQTENTGMEVEVSYDNYETIRECCKLPGNHRESSLDREDSISYDSMDNNFQEQPKRMLRSRQKKQRQMIKEPETSLQEMLGKGSVTRKGTSLKMKQGTPRFQSDKSELNSEQFDSYIEEETDGGPRTRLRNKIGKCLKEAEVKPKVEKQSHQKRAKTASSSAKSEGKARNGSAGYKCDVEGCTMSLSSKQELALHKRNICPVKGCGKKFFSHKYLVQHRRVHMDDRPLKCPWKGCKMTFKWSWARKEHIRVHTGARPYLCAEEGCGQTFRFVSDFSRHKRKTGHSTKKSKT